MIQSRSGLALTILFALAGCEEPAPTTLYCAEIAAACHEVDTGTPGPVTDCHELGHDGAEADCEPMHDSCIAICEAALADGGSGSADGG